MNCSHLLNDSKRHWNRLTLWMNKNKLASIVILIIRTIQQLPRGSRIDAYGGGDSNDVIRLLLPTRILGRVCPPRVVSFVWIPTTKAMSSYGRTILTNVPTVSTWSVPWIILCIFGRMTPIPVPSVDKPFYVSRQQHKVWIVLLRLLSQQKSSYHRGTEMTKCQEVWPHQTQSLVEYSLCHHSKRLVVLR